MSSLYRWHEICPSAINPANHKTLHSLLSFSRVKCSDLVRSIPSHHVQDRFVSTRMEEDPCVGLKYLAIQYYDFPTPGNQVFDLATRDDVVS